MKPSLANCLCLLAVVLALLPASLARAAAPYDSVTVAIVLDNSGSMAETDPDQVRLIAARLMVDLLDVGDRVTIISFSNDAQLVVPLTQIRSDADRAALKKPLHSAKPAGDTDYRVALQLASGQLAGAPSGQRAVLFLTDGEIHPAGWDQWTGSKRDAEIQSVRDIAGQYGKQGWKLFPLSFKRFIPQGSALLSDLSTRGHGFYRQVDDVSALNAAFQAIYSSLKGDVFQGLSEICADTPKTVLSSVRRMIVTVMAKTPGQTADLLPPKGFAGEIETRDDDDGFYRVLVVRNPAPGEWVLRPKGGQCVLVGSIDNHNVRVRSLSPSDQVAVGDELNLLVKVEQQTASSGDNWEPVDDADVSSEVTKPGATGTMRVKLSPVGGGSGVYEALLEAAALVKGSYRLDNIVSRLGQVVHGIPPVPWYFEVGAFPKLEVKVTQQPGAPSAAKPETAAGAAAGEKAAQAMAMISGDQPISNRKISWAALGPNGAVVRGAQSQDGQTFDFDVGLDGLYLITAVLEGIIQGERGPTNVRVAKDYPVLLVREEPRLRWLLGDRSKVDADGPSTVVSLRAAFLSGGQPLHVEKPALVATVLGPSGKTDEFKLSPDGEAFGHSWNVDRSGLYTLTVRGDARYFDHRLSQTDTAALRVDLARGISLQLSSKDWGAWNDAPKQFTLQATSNAAEPVKLDLRLSEPAISLAPSEFLVQPGEPQRFELTAQRAASIAPGSRAVLLLASSPDAAVDPAELSLGSVSIAGIFEYTIAALIGVCLLLVLISLLRRFLGRRRRRKAPDSLPYVGQR